MPKTPAEKLQQAVAKILKDYAEDETMTVKDLTRQFAQKGAQAVKNAAAGTYGGTGRYAKGWTSTLEETRFGAIGVIHNKTPGLPHLLEKGHAKRGGGRVAGRSHIAPVEEELVQAFERAVQNDL